MVSQKLTILCVDDEETALFFRKRVLQKSGFDVVTASSAAQAMEILLTEKINLVLSDVLMPGTLGTELAKLVKQAHMGIPVVLISGVNDLPPEASYADLFISKLEGPVALCEKLQNLLKPSISAASKN